MQKFIFKTTLFLAPVLVFFCAFEVLFRNMPSVYQFKSELIEEKCEETETLILGSSYAHYGINPAYLTAPAINIAYSGQGIDYDYFIFKKYENRFKNLKTILLTISDDSFYYSLDDAGGKWRKSEYVLNYSYPSDNLKYHLRSLNYNFNESATVLFKYYTGNYNTLKCSALGWGNDFTSDKAQDLLKTAEFIAPLNNLDINSELCHRRYAEMTAKIKYILSWSREHKINVILFTAPAYKTYRDRINKEQLRATFKTAQNLADLYSNVSYHNFFYDERFSKEDYYDANHLSDKGAPKLSAIVNKIIEDQQTSESE